MVYGIYNECFVSLIERKRLSKTNSVVVDMRRRVPSPGGVVIHQTLGRIVAGGGVVVQIVGSLRSWLPTRSAMSTASNCAQCSTLNTGLGLIWMHATPMFIASSS